MNKVCTLDEALDHVKPNMRIMIGGFLAVGSPERLIDALVERGTDGLQLIANDTAFPDRGIGKLVVNRQLESVTVCHIGTNPVAGELWQAGELEVELSPQGTLIERIRAAGCGLGGILTPVGVGTIVEEKARTIVVDDRKYLLETPLSAEVALVKAFRGDPLGNLVYRRTARNYNPFVATAADVVVAEVDELVQVGELDPDEIMTPGIFVDYVVPPSADEGDSSP